MNEPIIALSPVSTILDIAPYVPTPIHSIVVEAAETFPGISVTFASSPLRISNIYTTFQVAPEAASTPSTRMTRDPTSERTRSSEITSPTSKHATASVLDEDAPVDVPAIDFGIIVGQYDASESPEYTISPLSVAKDNILTGRASLLELGKGGCEHALPGKECSHMIAPPVFPAQVGTREEPILIEDVMDEQIDQQEADRELDLLIYAFEGDTKPEEEEKIKDNEVKDKEEEEKEDEEQEELCVAGSTAQRGFSEGESHIQEPKADGHLLLRRSRSKTKRPGIINWRHAVKKRINRVEKTWSTVQSLWIDLYSVLEMMRFKSIGNF